MPICPGCGEDNPPRFRLCGYCGTPLEQAAPAEVRKTVTVLFSDIAGSTSLGERLDPESLREVMGRYFDVMRAAVERHGGTVEKFIGDAVMAVFGLPQTHEDDALRAVRAALDMRRGLDALNAELDRDYGVTIANRTGVNTGEVVTDEAAGNQRLATGDAVNVAARLEQAAPAMETLLGALTHALVRDAVETEPVAPLELKGKAERVPAHRLLGLAPAPRISSAPLVGRDGPLALLREQVELARAAGGARLVTVLGEAGVGKSRLLREFTGELGAATLIQGRCLPYGEGITFWPLAEAVRAAAGIAEDDSPEQARAQVAALAGGDVEVADRVASAIGLVPTVHAVEETFWGVRRLFEILAAESPLVAVLEDMHWAEPTLLELVDHLVEHLARPCVLVCTTRTELLERGDLTVEAPGRVPIALERLEPAAAAAMAGRLLAGRSDGPAAVERIVAASGGNPLFMEQMAAMLADAEGTEAEVDVPPTILALLAARLDRLARPDRAVLEPAAVVGLVFPSTAVADLSPPGERADVPNRLEVARTRRFVRPHPPVMGDEHSYQFEHILVRDAVYRRLLKRTRAQLHERFVEWADRVNGDRAPEYAEITAYHLEQAHRYLAELGPLDDHGRELGLRASNRLGGAGQRAFARGDMHAAAGLLGRAADLLPSLHPDRLEMLPDLGEALMDVGEFARAEAVLREAIAAAAATGDHRLGADAGVVLLLVQFHGDADADWGGRALREARRAITVFELAGDLVGLAKAWRIIGSVHATALRYGQAANAVERAIECARAGGDARQERRNSAAFAIAAVYGPTPVAEAIARCLEIGERTRGDRRTEGLVLCARAQLEAMRGEFDEARRLYRRARAVLTDVGGSVLAASTSLDSSAVELLAGDPEAAERELLRDFDLLERMGERYLLSTMAGVLAQALAAQGRDAEAARMCDRAEEMAGSDDVESLVLVRSVRAELHLHAGRLGEAAAAAAGALELLEGADAPTVFADVLVVAARVDAARGDAAAAGRQLARAAKLHRDKGNVVAGRRVAESAAALGVAAVNA
jgi:class 3 adenylate cyclase/tetratricopeptide (TPR) repeat protein